MAWHMADKTFYRYIDANGDAHFVDVPTEIPRDYKGAVEKLTVKDDSLVAAKAAAAAKTFGVAEDAVQHMHWPSFAWGLGLAAVIFLFMRILALGKRVFIGIAAAVALGGLGIGFTLKDLRQHLPASMSGVLPSGSGVAGMPSPAEAKRILDSLPKAGADRDKVLETILRSEK
jgi:hypothetical protein